MILYTDDKHQIVYIEPCALLQSYNEKKEILGKSYNTSFVTVEKITIGDNIFYKNKEYAPTKTINLYMNKKYITKNRINSL
jgi:hypothetical protein